MPTPQIATVSRRGGRSLVGGVLLSCRDYFDWHPITAGFCLAVAVAVGLSVGTAMFAGTMPMAGGWAVFTPQNGIVLALLLMFSRRDWPWILLGYLAALGWGETVTASAPKLGVLQIVGNLAEVLIAAFTLPPYRNFKQWLLERRLLAAFAGYGLLLGPAVMSLTVAVRYAGSAGAVADLHAGFWERARTVGFAEALGIALATPLVLVLVNPKTYEMFRWRELGGTLGYFVLLGATTWIAFSSASGPAMILPYAVLVAIAFRRGLRGAVLGTALFAMLVAALGIGGHGFLSVSHDSAWRFLSNGEVFPIGSYMALAVLAVFPVSVTLVKRQELEERLSEFQAELDRLHSLDRLTGVANRKRFDLVLTREWQRGTRDPKPLALLMVDVDYFELYNEHYGPQAGDECLRLIAAKMAEKPHRTYDLVSRYEGGRFSVLLPGASGEAVERIAEEFRAEVAALEWPHERSTFERVTVSVGWAAIVPEAALLPDVLIAAAEQALRTAKRNGRNRVEGCDGNAVALTPTS